MQGRGRQSKGRQGRAWGHLLGVSGSLWSSADYPPAMRRMARALCHGTRIHALPKRSDFDLRHRPKADRVQRWTKARHVAKIHDPGFSRNALLTMMRQSDGILRDEASCWNGSR